MYAVSLSISSHQQKLLTMRKVEHITVRVFNVFSFSLYIIILVTDNKIRVFIVRLIVS
ncbi:hypothetical protein PMEGAS70_33680 [Priestia megaterium]|uniref:Uncharacterized protein n=1 Tax=Priestia megaterium TaxID=1404 RepID=A0AAX6BN58_PRIMG|nr:hypothetical protein ShirakiTB12_36150 [Priestia megaterium]